MKKSKGSIKVLNSYRGIFIVNMMSIILEKLLKCRFIIISSSSSSISIISIIIIISFRFLNVEVLPVVLSNSEYHFSVVFSDMYLGNKKMYIRDKN